MGHVLQGLLGMVFAMIILIFRPHIKRFVGNIGFAERYLGPGGTWTFLAVFAVALFILSLMWSTGSLQSMFAEKLGAFI